MPFYLVQGGSTLYRMSTAGVPTALTLPSGVTLSPSRSMRSATLGRLIVLANSPSQTLALDPLGRVRPLVIAPPATPVFLSAGGAGDLIGSYRVKHTFIVKDEDGRVIGESDFGPVSEASTALASNLLSVVGINRSSNPQVNGRRLYRTASGPGDTYFQWIDLDGNVATELVDGVTDEGLSTLAAPTDLGMAPLRLEMVVEWKDRLWAKGGGVTELDTVYFSASRKPWGWPSSNAFEIPPAGSDDVGITGFIPRRDELAICRQDCIHKIMGRTTANFERVQLVEGKGCIAPDSIKVIKDIGYFLGGDGVYMWSHKGVDRISDAVAGWFQSDRYFNRSRFPNAFAHYNETFNRYELHLAALGSSVQDRWVSVDLTTGKWYGPHQTAAFTPSSAAEILDTNGITLPVMGSSAGHVYTLNHATVSDDGSAIDYDVRARHTMNLPDIEKVCLELSAHVRPELGGTLDIIPALGSEDQAAQATISHNLTRDRMRHRRISTATNPTGRFLTLRFRNNENNRSVQLRGYEFPWFPEGRR